MRKIFINTILVVVAFLSVNAFGQVPQSEKDALIALYNSTAGDNWTNKTGWDVTNPNAVVTSWNAFTQTGWYGVTVTNGRVTKLALGTNNLIGTLPTQIGDFPMLKDLYLQSNQLAGSIPTEIGNLSNCVLIHLMTNKLTGSIPSSLGNLTALTALYLSNNQLSGAIPSQLGNLTNMVSLQLDRNKLTGSIPSDLGNLVKLTHLYLHDNILTGVIPVSLGNMNKLISLKLQTNKLSGSIPLIFGNLPYLIEVYLSQNELTGEIPSQMGNLPALRTLALQINQLTGPIPAGLGNLSNLTYLDIHRNQLSGPIPPQLGNLVKLTYLSICENDLSGTIPTQLGQLTDLVTLYAFINQLEGSIPTSFQNLTKLRTLAIYNNKLSGTIPDLTGLTLLRDFRIGGNRFRFLDFIDQYTAYKSYITVFTYTPQANTDDIETVTGYTGGSITLTMCTDGRYHSGDTFQWYKSGQIIAGATGRQLVLNNLSSSNAGTYSCLSSHTSNPTITLLSLQRNTVTLAVTSCPVPTSLNASSISTTSAVLSWQNPGGATSYEIEVVNASQSPTGIPTGTTATNSYTVTGLIPGTSYKYYVRSVCTSVNSTWAGPYTFETLACLSEGFENGIPATWNVMNNGVGTAQEWTTTNTLFLPAHGGSQHALIDRGSIGEGNTSEDWLVTPLVEVPTNGQLRFWTKMTLGGDFGTLYQLRVSTTSNTNQASFTTIQQWTEAELETAMAAGGSTAYNNYGEIAKSLSAYAGQNVYIAFVRVHTQNGATSNPYFGDRWLLDDVKIVEQCPDPLTLSANTITENSAILSWQNPGGATEWEIEMVQSPNEPTGIPTATSVTNPYTYTGLLAATQYHYYVRSKCNDCAEYTGNWVGPFIFLTRDPNVCYPPTNMAVTNYTGTTATVSWTPGYNEDNWEIGVQPFDGTPQINSNAIITPTTENLNNVILGLNSNTAYSIFVRSVCGTQGNSAWILAGSVGEVDYCTTGNLNAPIVKQLFKNLVNHLNGLTTVPQGYNNFTELTALSPYITDTNPKIYNYSKIGGVMKFSFALGHDNDANPNGLIEDVEIELGNGSLTDFNTDTYFSSEYYIINSGASFTNGTGKVNIRHINFCPDQIVSCTVNNPKTQVVKNLYMKLIDHLLYKHFHGGIPSGGYWPQELLNLAPYLTDPNPGIYNVVYEPYSMPNDGNTIKFRFSFAPHTEPDVIINNVTAALVQSNGPLTDVFVDTYTSPDVYLDYVGMISQNNVSAHKAWIRHINFCPEEVCVNHVAIVVDESGSLDDLEKMKIRRQLKNFVEQQRIVNNRTQGEMHISLIGMSDKDTDLRNTNSTPVTRNILQTKVTDATIVQFNNWIDSYGNRYGAPGISEASDYWKSGLDVALASTMKPDVVIMITDGAQTAIPLTGNNDNLQTTMLKFNNHSQHHGPLETTKPHLYVIGTDNGFYVDSDASAGRLLRQSEDPNYTADVSSTSLTARTTSSLKLSLKYLFDLQNEVFPTATGVIPSFVSEDYIGLPDFGLLGDDLTFLSDNLTRANIGCGDVADKNPCDDCFSFQPHPEKEYVLNAWAKEELNVQVTTYDNPKIKVIFKNGAKEFISDQTFSTKGDIIEGWQRIVGKFTIPFNPGIVAEQTVFMEFELINNSSSVPVFFDDIRIHPIDGSMKSFVYDAETFKLMSELDENNYSTYYEYDNEGGLVRIKKETSEGVKTIQETRSGNFIKQDEE